MKHNTKVTAILLIMFIITQLIGLFVISVYSDGVNLPYGMQPPEEIEKDFSPLYIVFAFILALSLFFVLIKIKAETFIRIWFFLVVMIALGLTFTAILLKFNVAGDLTTISIISLVIALPLAYLKIFKKDIVVHNITELLVYPGIAAVFIPILNVLGIIIILLLISIYDIWAVWHSKIMQKMAKYQINTIQVFTGFFIPYASKTEKKKIKRITQKYEKKGKKELEKQFKKAKIKVNLAILGGGDVIFPIIAAGIFYLAFNSIIAGLIISACASLALLGLFVLARKGKFYPAMPFITTGIYIGMLLAWYLSRTGTI